MSEENKAEAQPAILHALIQITRKATGKVEEYELTGTAEAVKAVIDAATEKEA